MNTDHRQQIEQLRNEANLLGEGEPRLMLLEEAVRLADTHTDVELGFELREGLVRTATFSGHNEKALVAFSWQLAQCDRNPEQFSERSLLWEYKWIVGGLTGFPDISRQQIEEMLADMTSRYERCGASLKAIHKLRCKIAQAMHETELARQCFRDWKLAPEGWPSDCAACDLDSHVVYLIFIGKDEKALEHARPLLEGKRSCAVVPQATYGAVLRPLFRLDRLEEAARYHLRGYRMIATNKDFLEEAANHLNFVVLTDNLGRAARLFERHLAWALTTFDLENRFSFYLAARLLFDRVADTGKARLTLRLPREFPHHQESGVYEVADLLAWADSACQDLAQRFDARNGNAGFADRLKQERSLKAMIRPWPLKGPS